MRRLAAAVALALLSGCGGGGSGGAGAVPAPGATAYEATIMVSDQRGAAHVNANLVDPWGLAFNASSVAWITNNGSSGSIVFDAQDATTPVRFVPSPGRAGGHSRPTGVVFNSGNGFEVSQEARTGVARFVTASQDGTLSGWAPSLGDPGSTLNAAVLAFDAAAAQAEYTGLAKIGEVNDAVLLAPDFRNGVVDSFGADFGKRPPGRFIDAELPAGYAPFGIFSRGGLVYVAYARRNATSGSPQAGSGLGAVTVFDASGVVVRRLVAPGGPLNAPWGMAIAPADFGTFAGALLVASTGDGTIAAFDPASGRPLGRLSRRDGSSLVIDGLHGIAFGNGAAGQPANALFFTAGPQQGLHGQYGRIDMQ